MLHLLPIRILLTMVIALVALTVLAAVYAGVIGTGNALADVKWIIRSASSAALAFTILPYAIWRWMPGLQRLIFPYLGGDWSGKLEFNGPRGSGTRDVKLTINHSLLKIILILDTLESTSRTLVVHADHDSGINRNRLYYVYLNERKEGTKEDGDRYRGLAVLRIESLGSLELFGDYFTETGGVGTLHLKRCRKNLWWMLWK